MNSMATTVGFLRLNHLYFGEASLSSVKTGSEVVQVQVRWTCGVMMEQFEEEEEQQLSDQSDLLTGSQDQVEDEEKPSQGQERNSGDEWDTDLETDSATDQKQSQSRAELYLQACQRTGSVPVSSFLRNLGDTNLNLNYYGVGPLGTKALAFVLQTDTTITNLELEENSLGPKGTRYLTEMLQTNITIQSLNLSNNQLGREGAYTISKMLSENYYVKSLKLSGNNFDDVAAKYFADALKGDYVIKELDLSHNMFSFTGGQHLGHMLAANVGIEVLNLSWNPLRLGGAMAVSAGLKVNSTLKQLDLSWNAFGQMEAESLGQALKNNRTLVLLDLSGNHVDDQAVTLLCQGLITNGTLGVLKTVFVKEEFVEQLEEARQKRPALDVRYSAMSYVTRNLSVLQILRKFLSERNESIMDFFEALDKEGTTNVSTSDFRKAVKEANIPLDHQQLNWLLRKFDKNCTATIMYSEFAELS
ncbi:leucine-rich repeat-containing protein 74A-like isoform X2 [Pseudochaenichthys georgianus]|uniref:leucine-rich repeat-containing protein 74A-like isoform X2 n=1 Tax=Pseudochaenichthys georgianus TaxID=52239 RepID=UPI00146D4202|nr:leucine-rich repeat-containing protein 74A-like isoform X2 [Pseudochaenichthys georgianus]